MCQNIACGVYANQYDIINPLGESQAPANNDLITERNKYNKVVLMCHLNINSIQNKFEEIASLIKKSRTQLMIVSESNIDSSYPNSQFTIPGYGLHRNDRKKRGGGILDYVSSELICKRIKPVKSYKTIEVIVLDIMGCRDGAVVRALASHQCGPGLIPRLGVICGLSLLVLYSAPRGFLLVLRFPLSSKTNI